MTKSKISFKQHCHLCTFVFKLSSSLETGVLLFSGDDTHIDWSIGIELRTDEPHIKSNLRSLQFIK